MKKLRTWKRCIYCGQSFKRLDAHQRVHWLHRAVEFANNPLVQLTVFGRVTGFVQLQLEDRKT